MSKIAIIDYCGDCPLRYYKNNDLHCETTDDKVSENLPCPPNCPLPDLLEATRIERERCLKIVAEEEEFDGATPDELFTLFSCACGDREYIENLFRSVVRITKQGIKAKIEADK